MPSPRPLATSPRVLAALAILIGSAACASRGSSATEAPGAVSTRAYPLGALLGADRVVVIPTRFLIVDRRLGWVAALDTATTLGGLDDEIRFAMSERGVGGGWAWGDEVRRSVARSAGVVPDVRRLVAEPLVNVKAGDAITVPDPLRSHLRALGALHGARYVLYPLVLSFAPTTDGPSSAGRAVLRIALIDVRTATVEWIGDVASEPANRYGPAIAAGLASKVGDLVLTRP